MYSFFSSLFSDIRALPRPVYILVAGQFLNRFGSFVFPFLTLYLLAADYSSLKIASIIGGMGFGNMLGPIAGGYCADAIGRKRTIVISLFGSALSMLAIYFVTESYLLLLLVGFAHGFLNFLFGPASNALLTDLVPSENRVTAYALVRLAMNGGFAAGPAIGGLLYVYAPWLIFVGDAFTTVLFGLLALLYLPHGLRTIEGRATSPRVFIASWKAALRDLTTHHLFKQYLLATVLMAIGFWQVFIALAVTTADQGLPASHYGLIMSLNGLLILLVEMPVTHWLKRFPEKPVLFAGFLLIGAGLCCFAMAESFVGFVLAMLLFTLGEIVALPVGMAYSSHLAPERFRGRYLGLRGVAWGFAGLIASGGVWFYGQLGIYWWIIAGLFAVAGGLVFALPIKSTWRRAMALALSPKKTEAP
ncbi:MAG: MFS transporter [Verrucomicrobiota bacterium]